MAIFSEALHVAINIPSLIDRLLIGISNGFLFVFNNFGIATEQKPDREYGSLKIDVTFSNWARQIR